ncbi:hypothetical protein C8R45DRAFT_1220579 [Mycena sanguinolenta]|nr:hypothetical protein C8R45DRAFT_1220579 [Mycena sanguinolenta]
MQCGRDGGLYFRRRRPTASSRTAAVSGYSFEHDEIAAAVPVHTMPTIPVHAAGNCVGTPYEKRLLLSAVYFCITLASALHTNQSAAVTPQSRGTCGDPSIAVALYEYFNSGTVDYFLTPGTSVNSGTGPYNFQGGVGFVFVTNEPSTVPFYRLHKTGNVDTNFWTTSTDEVDSAVAQGFTSELAAPFLHIYPSQICGAVPLFRVSNSGAQANFYTTSESERLEFITNMGYQDLGIAGFIYPFVATDCM